MTYLADVNFLVALLHSRHVHASRAAAWLESLGAADRVGICRVAQLGVLRVLTNRTWLAEDVLRAGEVWAAWDLLLADDRFLFLPEPANLESEWRRLTAAFRKGRMAETDAYLAAFARAGGLRILTFDRGFRDFAGVAVELAG